MEQEFQPMGSKGTTYKQMLEDESKIVSNLSKVKYEVAIYSGKGGVGKTTITINLAAALAARGKQVAILDADIDNPNVCKLLGLKNRLEIVDGRVVPLEKNGIKIVSMAALAGDEEKATAMRGALISKTLQQFMMQTDWGVLDYLLVDLPPGTSDAPMTIMQHLPLDGFIIITTPQEVAVLDAIRSGNLVKEMKLPILGVIENMAGEIFGSGGGEKVASKLGARLFGKIDLNKSFRECSDKGEIPVISSAEVKQKFDPIVDQLESELKLRTVK
ncbi:MAG: Mrp/NBP35 family ATP-binding protein [Candidatus Micrarchaeota archaeon]